MSTPKKVLAIENELAVVPSIPQERLNLVATDYSELIQNDLVDAMLVRLMENGHLDESNLQRIRQIVADRRKKALEIQAERQKRFEEIQKSQNTFDSKFPRLFRQNRLSAMEYLKNEKVKLEEITAYLKTLQENPRHYESLFAYDVPAAIAMVSDEIERRK